MKTQMLILVFMVCCLLWGNHYRQTAINLREQKETYRQNTELLLMRIRNIYDEKIKLEQKTAELEQLATEDKGYFDWHTDISNTHVIRSLRQN